MAVKIAQLLVGISADTKQLKKSLADSKKEFRGFVRDITTVLGGLGLTLGITAAVRGIRTTVDEVDRLAKSIRNLGIEASRLGQLEVLAGRSSVPLTGMLGNIRRQVRRISEAAAGGGEARTALAELGFEKETLQALNQLDPVGQLEKIAGAMAMVRDQSDKVRIGFKLWDSEGVMPMLEVISAGADGIRDAAEAAQQMGRAVTQEQLQRMERFATAWAELGLQAGALKRELVIEISPAAMQAIRFLRNERQRADQPTRREIDFTNFFNNSRLGRGLVQLFGGTAANRSPIQPDERLDLGNFRRFMGFQIGQVRQARTPTLSGLDIMRRGITGATVARGRENVISGAAAGIAGAARGISNLFQRTVNAATPFIQRRHTLALLAQQFAAAEPALATRRLVAPNPAIMAGSIQGFTALRQNFRVRETMEQSNEERNRLLGRIVELLGQAGNEAGVAEMF